MGIENKEHQNDWIVATAQLKLREIHNDDLNFGVIRYSVPEGEESKWKDEFKKYPIVDWVELNSISDVRNFL